MTATSVRLGAIALCLGLLASACGSRAGQEQIELAQAAALSAGGGAGQPGDVLPTEPVAGETTGPDAPLPGETSAPAPGQTAGPAQPGATEPPGGNPGEDAPPADTRAAPPGGNGGETDVGVSEAEIRIGVASDITGAVAGLFADTQKAVQAYFQFFAATEGTIYGRAIRPILKDTALTRQGNFTAYTDLCGSAFMAAGSMSAFDEGIEDPVRGCGIPDLRTAAVNPAIQVLPSVFSSDAMRPKRLPMTEYNYWKEQFPEAVTKAGYIFIDNNTTRAQTAQNKSGTEKIGYQWLVYTPVDISAISYKTQIREMKNRGVRFVTFQGAYQQAAKLAREMVEEQFFPDVFALQMNVYDPRLLVEGGAHLERFPVQIAVLSSLVEEIELSEELQTYRTWLKQIDPDAEPTGLGMYAWSAAKLTVQLLKDIGPEVTRAKMNKALEAVRGWDGGGIVPPQDVGTREPADCSIIVEVRGGAFVRIAPSQPGRFRCDNHVVDTA